MFCPSCKDEFRPGFTRCGRCDVDLVDDLSGAVADHEIAPPVVVRVRDYCGFLSLEDARQARDRLREHEIVSEIAIRDVPGGPGEEFWLRVDATRYQQVDQLLNATASCSACGLEVPEEAPSCPGCGAEFGAS